MADAEPLADRRDVEVAITAAAITLAMLRDWAAEDSFGLARTRLRPRLLSHPA